MGGGGEHHHAEGPHGHGGGDFRSKVWSMTGGANCRPTHWKRNTAFAMCGIVLICIPIAMKSAELEAICGSPLTVIGGSVCKVVDVLVCVLTSVWCNNYLFSVIKIGSESLILERCFPNIKQRPHLPVRPIPSQLWCKNFGNKDY